MRATALSLAPTSAGPNFRWMAGSSLGGLISYYAGLAHSDTWTRIAAFSPSIWWDNRHMLSYAASRQRAGLARVYHDMGTSEGSAQYITDLRDMRTRFVDMGFRVNLDLLHIEAAGGDPQRVVLGAANAPDAQIHRGELGDRLGRLSHSQLSAIRGMLAAVHECDIFPIAGEPPP